MSDYTQITDFSAKDALTTGDPEKIILGSDVDAEFDAIATAVATKFDSGDVASQAQAEAESSNVVLMTPGRVANWADYNAGIVGDLQAITDPGADRVFGWDESANAAIAFALSTGLVSSTTNILIDTTVVPQLAAANEFTNRQIYDVSAAASHFHTYQTNNVTIGYIGDREGVTGGAAGAFAVRGESALVLAIGSNEAVSIDNSLNFNFKSGTVTTNNASASEVGYKGTPVRLSGASDVTLALSDAGGVIVVTSASCNTITLPAEGTVAFPIGTVLTITVGAIGDTVAFATTSDTVTMIGSGLTGGRTLAANSLVTLLKVSSANWIISGVGLS